MSEAIELELTQVGAQFTALELRLPDNLQEQAWASIGRKLIRSDQIMQWWIGDWAAFGAGNPDKEGWRKKGALKEFCEANGIDYGYTRNRSWVSSSIHLSLRRDTVPWSYFQELAPLKPKEQMKWLKKVEVEELSIGDLRTQIRISKGEAVASESDGPKVEFPATHADKLIGWLRGRDPEFWTPGNKSAWREILQPIVSFWEGLA